MQTQAVSRPTCGYCLRTRLPHAFEQNEEFAPAIEGQAKKSLLRPDPQLDHAISNSHDNGLPKITVSSL